MSKVKLIALLLISFVAIGSVIYQLRDRGPTPPAASVPTNTATATQRPQAVTEPASPAPAPVFSSIGARPNIPANGWGRNPFLTRDEINAANKQPEPEIVQAPIESVPPPPPPAPAPPAYSVTAILYGPNGSFAVVNSRVVQAGDRVGMETVKEIKNRAVVLEYEGRTRELPLRRVGPEIELVPRGD
jgi:hypothetical protein